MQRRTNVVWSVLACVIVFGGMALVASAAEVDPSGTWQWEYEFQGRKVLSTVALKVDGDQLTGTYKRGDRQRKIENGKVDGDQVSFQIGFEANGRKVVVKFKGKLEEDTIDGKVAVKSDEWSGEFDWKATRRVTPADVAGTWKFKVTAENGEVMEPSIKLSVEGDSLKGAYTSRFGEFEAKEIAIKDGQLTFVIGGEYEGQKWRVTYKGKPRGDAIKGKIDFDFSGNTGTVDFEGQRSQ